MNLPTPRYPVDLARALKMSTASSGTQESLGTLLKHFVHTHGYAVSFCCNPSDSLGSFQARPGTRTEPCLCHENFKVLLFPYRTRQVVPQAAIQGNHHEYGCQWRHCSDPRDYHDLRLRGLQNCFAVRQGKQIPKFHAWCSKACARDPRHCWPIHCLPFVVVPASCLDFSLLCLSSKFHECMSLYGKNVLRCLVIESRIWKICRPKPLGRTQHHCGVSCWRFRRFNQHSWRCHPDKHYKRSP